MVAEVHVRAPVEVREVLHAQRHGRHQSSAHRGRRRAHVQRTAVERLDKLRHPDELIAGRGALAAEPGHAFLHEVPAQQVAAGRARERDVRLQRDRTARRHIRSELGAEAFPQHGPVRGERPPVVAEVDRVRATGGPGEVARVRERDGHGRSRAAHSRAHAAR